MTSKEFEALTRRQAIGRGALGLGGVLGLGALAGCGGGQSSSSSGGGAGASAGKAGGEITIGAFKDDAMNPIRDVYVKRFEQETGIKVKYNETAYDSWYQNAKNDGMQKTGAYDVYVMDDNWVPEFAASGVLQNLDELGLKPNPDILAKGLEQGYWPPKSGARLKDFEDDDPALYALVMINDVEILYYNEDHFGEAPKTWDDIVQGAKRRAKPGKLYGWSLRGVKGNPIVMSYLPFLNSYGASFVNEDWSPGFAGPEGVAALERMFSLIPYMPAGVAEFDTDQEIQVLLQGKCMAISEWTGLSRRVDDPESSKVVGKLQMAATPSQERSGPAIGTFIGGIPAGAKNPEGAKTFLEWFTSDEIQLEFARNGGNAAVTGKALSDATAVEESRWLPAIADAVNASVPKPKTPDEPKFEDILGTRLNQALIEAVRAKGGYEQIAQKHLTAAANEMTKFIKTQGGYA